MFVRCLDILLAAVLLAFFLPLLVCYSIVARLDSGRSHSNRSRLFKISLLEQQIAGVFNFERTLDGHACLEAYGYLVDFSFAGGRL